MSYKPSLNYVGGVFCYNYNTLKNDSRANLTPRRFPVLLFGMTKAVCNLYLYTNEKKKILKK